MAVSEAQKKANAKYRSTKRKQIVIDMSEAQRDQINSYCKSMGTGTATYIKQLLRDDMRKNGVEPIEL